MTNEQRKLIVEHFKTIIEAVFAAENALSESGKLKGITDKDKYLTAVAEELISRTPDSVLEEQYKELIS